MEIEKLARCILPQDESLVLNAGYADGFSLYQSVTRETPHAWVDLGMTEMKYIYLTAN